MTAAIGASIAVLTSSRSNRKTAGSRKQNQQSITSWLCACRGNSYLRFRYRIVNLILIISRERQVHER